ncbi:MAG: hypothetical protein K2N91_04555 [Muribaculaceae bacterium]|nr:hypothetical protein [Muribaculaceae bacterium]
MKSLHTLRLVLVALVASIALGGCAAMGRSEAIEEMATRIETGAPDIPAQYPIYSSAAVDCEGDDIIVIFKLLPEYKIANVDKQAVDSAKKAMTKCLRDAFASDELAARAVEAMQKADSSFVLKFIDTAGESLIIKVPAKEISK